MNRRNFINSILVAGAAFSILPGAGRLWRVSRKPVELVPFWRQTNASARCVDEGYAKALYQLQQRAFVDTFFFDRPIPNINAKPYTSLPAIATIGAPHL